MKLHNLFLTTIIGVACTLSADANQIDVFVGHGGVNTPTETANVQVFNLSKMNKLLAKMQQHINANYKSVPTSKLKGQVKSMYSKYQSSFKAASKGLSLAEMYQIKGVPTIVIDGKYQVVGTSNVALAMAAYNRYIAEKHHD